MSHVHLKDGHEDDDEACPPPYAPAIHLESVEPSLPPPPYEEPLASPVERPHKLLLLFGSNGIFDIWGRLRRAVNNTVGSAATCLYCFGFFGALGIMVGMVVLGALFFYDCPAEPKIPIMLIIGGGVIVLANIVNCKSKKPASTNEVENAEENPLESKTPIKRTLFAFLFLVWLGLFSYCVYNVYKPSFDSRNEDYCHPILYMTTFWLLNISYVILFIICIC